MEHFEIHYERTRTPTEESAYDYLRRVEKTAFESIALLRTALSPAMLSLRLGKIERPLLTPRFNRQAACFWQALHTGASLSQRCFRFVWDNGYLIVMVVAFSKSGAT